MYMSDLQCKVEPGIRENWLQVWGPEQENGHTLCRQKQKIQAWWERKQTSESGFQNNLASVVNLSIYW